MCAIRKKLHISFPKKKDFPCVGFYLGTLSSIIGNLLYKIFPAKQADILQLFIVSAFAKERNFGPRVLERVL